MTAVSYMASGLSGTGMSAIVQAHGFYGWFCSLMLGLLSQVAFIALSGLLGQKRQEDDSLANARENGKYQYSSIGSQSFFVSDP